MCGKVVDKYPFTFEFVPDCHKTQEMCKKAASKDSSKLLYCRDKYKNHCEKAVSKDPLMLKYCPYRSIT